jgi:hypothetical protein
VDIIPLIVVSWNRMKVNGTHLMIQVYIHAPNQHLVDHLPMSCSIDENLMHHLHYDSILPISCLCSNCTMHIYCYSSVKEFLVPRTASHETSLTLSNQQR